MLKLLQAIAAFCDGFFTGLKSPPQRITPYLESDSPQPQLPSAQRQPLTQIELEIIAQAETVQMSRSQLVEFIDTNYLNEEQPPAEGAIALPEMNRADLVMFLLDEAWNRGKSTYNDLIAYVEEQSGEGCSRRAIANWKKSRKLNGKEQAAA